MTNNKIIKKMIFISGFLVIFVLSAGRVLAADYGLDTIAGAANLNQHSNTAITIGNVIGAGLSLIGLIFFVLMLYAGIMWMTAHGKEEQTKKALDTVIAAAIGMIIVLSAYAITNFAFSTVTQNEETPIPSEEPTVSVDSARCPIDSNMDDKEITTCVLLSGCEGISGVATAENLGLKDCGIGRLCCHLTFE
jgi:hypothetical protein